MTASKAELRRLVRETEKGLSPEAVRESDRTLAERFLSLEEYKRAKTLFLYAGTRREPDTRSILAAALRDGKTVALPKITGPGVMEARRIGSLSGLVPDRYNIPAPPPDSEVILPKAFDLILVPGAAFTPDGARLGRGGGYYDRFLSKTRGLKIALVRREFVFPALPVEEHDIKMDILITDD